MYRCRGVGQGPPPLPLTTQGLVWTVRFVRPIVTYVSKSFRWGVDRWTYGIPIVQPKSSRLGLTMKLTSCGEVGRLSEDKTVAVCSLWSTLYRVNCAVHDQSGAQSIYINSSSGGLVQLVFSPHYCVSQYDMTTDPDVCGRSIGFWSLTVQAETIGWTIAIWWLTSEGALWKNKYIKRTMAAVEYYKMET